ncbi:MAG: sulfite exporter TauE/SafE family protein [Bacteroidales bacterium]|nr:sulfite exporter TauE/SafE family protein [Bacteroidales bacterium]
MILTEGFLLGISTGAVCLVYCGPVLIPYLLGEGKNVRQNAYVLILFLSGRILAYSIVGFLAGLLGTVLLQSILYKSYVFGVIYILLAVLLILYGFYRFKEICLGHLQQKINSNLRKQFPRIVPFISGVITGFNICPPFLIAITKASDTGSITSGILFFLMFFMGTSLYFVPLPFTGFLKRQQVFRIIGKFASIVTGFIFLYQGTLKILN